MIINLMHYRVDSRLCVKDTIMFRDNTPYDTETTEGGLFCVQTDNCKF